MAVRPVGVRRCPDVAGVVRCCFAGIFAVLWVLLCWFLRTGGIGADTTQHSGAWLGPRGWRGVGGCRGCGLLFPVVFDVGRGRAAGGLQLGAVGAARLAGVAFAGCFGVLGVLAHLIRGGGVYCCVISVVVGPGFVLFGSGRWVWTRLEHGSGVVA
ncbi:hypothetical protein CesoFtcFv8_017810 [Champsocephalus esox]|uniref:Transmembrane protein n=1 Tax=Champsocephalus esox TaxID=159716 RepID=A0AAN8BKL8_9TELE|nr:hypothetical protein CesoFtcFv8_017810 [Champsocephalus esox]